MSTLARLFSAILFTLALGACGGSAPAQTSEGAEASSGQEAASADIVDTASSAGGFTTLVAAVQAAGLVDTLKGAGPFTVFAPTDEAFAALPPGTLEELLKPENKEKLVAILTYHVVAGDVRASDVVKLDSATTVQGGSVAIQSGEAGVKVGESNVVKTDIACTNGVIHVIDKVLIPAT